MVSREAECIQHMTHPGCVAGKSPQRQEEATIFQISGITKTLSLWLFFKKPAHIIVGESGEEKKLIGNCNGNKIGSADWHGDIIPVNASQRLSKNCQQPTASNRS
jgi:hypothetical protein